MSTIDLASVTGRIDIAQMRTLAPEEAVVRAGDAIVKQVDDGIECVCDSIFSMLTMFRALRDAEWKWDGENRSIRVSSSFPLDKSVSAELTIFVSRRSLDRTSFYVLS